MNRYITFLVMGAPGSGKGTQGKVIGTVPRFFHCACGEVFRSLDLRTPLGQQFIDYSSKGLLVPDDLTVELWRTKIEAQVQFKPGTRGCGIMLRTSEDLENSYYIRLEPQNHRMVFDAWPRVPADTLVNVDEGHMANLDRWIDLDPSVPIDLKVLVDRSTAVVYAGGRTAMCLRMYNLPAGRWGLFVDEGSARFRNIKVTAL